MAPDDWMRAGDRDREVTADILREAYAEGRLDRSELQERADAAFRARTWVELRRLTADIPPPDPNGGLPAGELGRPPSRAHRPPLARRTPSLSVLMLAVLLACVVTGAVARNVAVVAVAALVGSAVAICRG